MISRRFLPAVLAVLALAAAVDLHADACIALNSSVAQPVQFPNHAAGAIASNGSVIGVAKGATDGTQAVYFATYDQNLTQLTPDVLVASQSQERSIALFWNGSEFGLFYRSPGYELIVQRASSNGTLIGAPIGITPHGAFPDQAYDFAWDPVRQLYLVAVASSQGVNPGLYLVGVARDGTIHFDLPITSLLSRLPTPRVSSMADGRVGLIWGYPDVSDATTALTFETLDASNNPSLAIPITAAAASPRIANNGSQFQIVFSAPKSGGGTELHSVTVSAASTIVASESKVPAGKGTDVVPIWLLWNAARSEWALSYLDYPVGVGNFPPDYRLYRSHADSSTIGNTLFSPDPSKNIIASPYPFLPIGLGYVTGTERFFSRGEGSESYLTRQCPLTTTVVPSRTPFVGVPVTFNAVISGGTAPLTYSWDFGDAVSATGPSPLHTYVQPATYPLSLLVTDMTGATAAFQQSLVVIRDPCAGVSVTVPVSVSIDKPTALVNEVVTVNATTTSAFQPGYTWTFGDGTTGAGATTTHRFAQAGVYIVTVTPNVNGCSATNSSSVTVNVVSTRRRRAK